MRCISLLIALASLILAAAPAGARPVTGKPAAPGSAAVLSDVSNAYAQMETSIELQFGKLMRDAKRGREALEDKIKSLESQIEKLKQAAKKIELVAKKMEELLPKFVAAVGSDPGGGFRRTPSKAKGSDLETLLEAELAKAGVPMSPKQIQDIAAAIEKGGQGGMGTALQMVITIAEAGVGKSPDFPKVLPADVSNAAGLPHAAAAAFLSKRFSDQVVQKIAETNNAIKTLQEQIKALQEQIKELTKQIAKLEQEKQKALLETRKQKEKALDEARKVRDVHLIRLPTPLPTPKKP